MRNLFHIQDDNRIKVFSTKTNKYYSTKLQVALSNEKFEDLEVVHDNGFWDKVSWTKEPTQNYLDLLDERCKQLREKYDYLILYYSGGSDTETVLQSFMRSRTHLDEIVINRICFNNNDAPLLDIDLAILKLKNYARFMPGTRITINNIDDKIITDFCNKERWVDTPFNGTIGMIRRLTVYDFAEYNSTKVHAWGNVGQIYGENKPVMSYKDGVWYNKLSGWGIAAALIGEWFFTSPDLPELHIKQCHMVKNYWIEHNLPLPYTTMGGLSDGGHSHSPLQADGRSIRQHLEAACRLPFDQRWQPVKASGLGNDIKDGVADTEDSLVYKHMKKYAPDLLKLWNYSIIVPIVKEINQNNHLDINKLDMSKLKIRDYAITKEIENAD